LRVPIQTNNTNLILSLLDKNGAAPNNELCGAGYTPPAGSGKHRHLNGGNGLNAAEGGYEPGWVASDDGNIGPTSSTLFNCSGNGVYATWTPVPDSQENLPINCVNWYEAYAFCIWDGGFLPSDAELEYAAAGGSQQREYPWGMTDPGSSSQYAIYDCYYPNVTGGCTSGMLHIAPVGTATLGGGLWGQLDLAGNIWEWDLDWWSTQYVSPCADCARFTALAGFSYRALRSGEAHSLTSFLLPPSGNHSDPSGHSNLTGFRCARTP